jgi:nucleoside-diphosphate-sugar epimerase
MLFLAVLCIPLIFYLYMLRNDRALKSSPASAIAFSKERWTPENCRVAAEQLSNAPLSVADQIPPKTGRRYIVVGGVRNYYYSSVRSFVNLSDQAGFVGGWVVLQLLHRGEDPRNIRVLDIRPPTRHDLTTGLAKDVEFLRVDISDSAAVDAAFKASWPRKEADHLEGCRTRITIFHTAANIRFYERHPALISRSAAVNIKGTKNVIAAAKSIGANTLIYTSSGSVAVRRSRFWLWPWETEPKYFVQVLNDDDAIIPKRHEDFFSNYAVTKCAAEWLVWNADGSSSGSGVLKTGCIGNGVFGSGGDLLCGDYLFRQNNPTWIPNILQSFVYVENCSLAHLCYERRLIDIAERGSHPDISGQAFIVTDPGPPAMYGDVYLALETLGNAQFPLFSPTSMLLLAHIFEAYNLTRFFLISSKLSVTATSPIQCQVHQTTSPNK